jgi:DNA-binding LacI/PurR family transcriptional regulator
MANGRRRATQADIARHLGVSQATVSIALRGGLAAEQVAPATRQSVLDLAAQLGYSANAVARSLRGGRNRILGLFTFEPVFPIEQRDFYYPFLVGVEQGAAESDHELLLFTSAGATGSRRIYARGENRLKVADGCVLLGRQMDRDDLARLVREDFPFVFIGHREVEGADLSYVAADYRSATRDIVQRLIDLGHTEFVYLREEGGLEPTRDREAGVWDAIDHAGIPREQVRVQTSAQAIATDPAQLRRWVDSGVTAFIVEPTADRLVIDEVADAAQVAGIRIPEDCSMVLLGDSTASGVTRDWSRFSLPRTEMGRAAVGLLIEMLDNDQDEARHLYLPCLPVAGDSVGPRSQGVMT